jgi:hypothetical protein
MKRLLALFLTLLPVFAVTGCPMYPDECDSTRDCARGYACDRGLGECVLVEDERPAPGKPDVPARCTDASDCRSDQVCDRFQRCVSAPGGSEGGAGGEPAQGGTQAGAAGDGAMAGGAGESSGGAAGSH